MSILNKNRFKILCGIFLLTGGILLTIMNLISNKGVEIVKWDNYYNENNIVFFYEDHINEKLDLINSTYGIKEQVNSEKSEINKVLKAFDIVRSKISVANVENTGLNNGYDILSMKTQSNKTSFRDMAIVARDFLNCLGIRSRIGVFRKGQTKYHSDVEYYVIEYWSTEDNKWVMVDFSDGGYFEDDKSNKLSAIEVINSNIKKVSYMGNTSQLDYKNNISKYFDSYTLSIENSSEKKRSNCNVTYIKNESAVEYKIKNVFTPPTVFTKETKLFEKSPFDKLVGSDEKAYLLVCGSISNNEEEDKNPNNKKTKEKEKKENNIFVAAFKDDKVLKSYYLNINGQGYEQVENNKEVKLENGSNTIELSLDGQNTMTSVVIEKK